MNETPDTQIQSTQPTEPKNTPIWRRKSMLIGGTLGAAALLVGGVAVGAATAGDDDEEDRPTTAATRSPFGASDANALTAVLSAAQGQVTGTVTSVEANPDGSWSVDVENNGDETTVRVTADGAASVVRTDAADADDANDPAPAGTLSDTNVAMIVEAALGEAKGRIVEIDLDDQPSEAYSVQVRADDGTETEIDLSTDFSVTRAETDRD